MEVVIMDNIFDFAKATIHDYLDYSRSFSLIKSQDIRNRLETYYDSGQIQAEGEYPAPRFRLSGL